jgi:hypothetical protein
LVVGRSLKWYGGEAFTSFCSPEVNGSIAEGKEIEYIGNQKMTTVDENL